MTLTSSQNAKLAQYLQTLDREVRDKIRETMPQLADQKYLDLVGVVYDSGDEAAARTLEDFDHTLLEHYLRELRKIEDARARLAAGTIDRCVDCGGDIGYERLRVQPGAARCIECQTRHEKRHRDEVTQAP